MPSKKSVSVKVIGREKEYLSIKKVLNSFIEHNALTILYINGVPGSGKTYTVSKIFDEMKEDGENLSMAYINCSSLNSKASIYKAISDNLNCIKSCVPYLSNLRSHFCSENKCSEKHIIVIDEIDFLISKNETILYNLFEMPYLENSSVMFILLSNTLSALSSKIESRIGKNRIEFRPYTATQLKSIFDFKKTQKDGKLRRNISNIKKVDDKVLEFLTKKVASTTGDIRKINDILETNKNLTLGKVNIIMKNYSSLLNMFMVNLNYYQKVTICCLYNQIINDEIITIPRGYESFKIFCRLKNINIIDFFAYKDILEELSDFGIIKIKGEFQIVSNYIDEELENAMKEDEVLTKLLSKKVY